MPASSPFCTASVHAGAWHLPPLQTPLEQSAATLQKESGSHTAPAQLGPPQSMSLSPSLRTPSAHVGGWHTLFVQTPLTQSIPPLHASPSAQASQLLPPQSVSVSVPFFVRS